MHHHPPVAITAYSPGCIGAVTCVSTRNPAFPSGKGAASLAAGCKQDSVTHVTHTKHQLQHAGQLSSVERERITAHAAGSGNPTGPDRRQQLACTKECKKLTQRSPNAQQHSTHGAQSDGSICCLPCPLACAAAGVATNAATRDSRGRSSPQHSSWHWTQPHNPTTQTSTLFGSDPSQLQLRAQFQPGSNKRFCVCPPVTLPVNQCQSPLSHALSHAP